MKELIKVIAFDADDTRNKHQKSKPIHLQQLKRFSGRVGLGISAQTSHRTVRESLPSYGSSHPNGFNRLGLTPCCQW